MSTPEPTRAPGSAPELTPSRNRLWIVVGLLIVCLVLFSDLTTLLADIRSAKGYSYGPTAFAGIQVDFWNVTNYRDAIVLWNSSGFSAVAHQLLSAHALVDLVFIASFAMLLISRSTGKRRWLAAGLVIADVAETIVGWALNVKVLPTAHWLLVTERCLSAVKWGFCFSWVVATLLYVATHNNKQRVPVRDRLAEAPMKFTNSRTRKVIATFWPLLLLVSFFGVLVAVPSGGPLQQIPDILRAELQTGWSLSTLMLVLAPVLLAGCVGTSAVLLSETGTVRDGSSFFVGGFAAALTGVLALLQWVVGGSVSRVCAAPLVVFVLGFALSWLGTNNPAVAQSSTGQPLTGQSFRSELPDRNRCCGAFAGAVIVVFGLGLVRAAFPLVFSFGRPHPFGWLWSVALVVAIAVSVGGGWATQQLWCAMSTGTDANRAPRKAVLWVCAGVAVVGVVVLTIRPGIGGNIGAAAVLALSFSAWSMLAGALGWVSRSKLHWRALGRLGMTRTPWGIALAVTYAIASTLNTTGGYHGAVVQADRADAAKPAETAAKPTEPAAKPYASVSRALDDWLSAQNTCRPTGPIPLVIVAAPGGGIRAASFTANALEELFPSECAKQSLFAVSAVSGGSVGAAFWLGANGDQPRPINKWLPALSGERAFATSLAGMVFRDLQQPLLGIQNKWSDRAELLEDGWMRETNLLETKLLTDLNFGSTSWRPIVVLNATSVTNGCRVLLTNVHGLPAVANTTRHNNDKTKRKTKTKTSTREDLNCRPNTAQSGRGGTAESAIDLNGVTLLDAPEKGKTGQLSAVTSAMLSARFPFISPSGALYSNEYNNLYLVDGGYGEGSGVLSALDIFEQLQRTMEAAPKLYENVVPMLVVTDSSYPNPEGQPGAKRPLEFFLPLKAKGPAKQFSNTASLLQRARWMLNASANSSCRGKVVHLYPPAKPQVEAPLGWVLSKASQTSIAESVQESVQSAMSKCSCLALLRKP